jgi:hypothetical protein
LAALSFIEAIAQYMGRLISAFERLYILSG